MMNKAKNVIDVLGKQYAADQWTNITPRLLQYAERQLYLQTFNPIWLISERVRHFFRDNKHNDIGYKYREHSFVSPVVTTEDNFDSLLISKDHVSRGKSDTYYVNSNYLLRSHTSAHQLHCLQQGSKAFISIADCYRRDEIDRSHFPVFHQCEVFKLYNNKEVSGNHATLNDLYDNTGTESNTKQAIYTQQASDFAEIKLKSTIEAFVRDIFDDQNIEIRWVPAYFPFTHPSFELEILLKDKWIEVLGCGVVRDEILQNAGIRDHIGFAAGFGLERFGMLKYHLPDIRLFWSKDSGFSHQFENKTPYDTIHFKPFSSCPQCINDLSFWLPQDDGDNSPTDSSSLYSSNDFYDICRSVAGDLIEQVKLVDEFTHPKTKRKSHCYKIVYRAADRVLTKEEVNAYHQQIADSCRSQFKIELR